MEINKLIDQWERYRGKGCQGDFVKLSKLLGCSVRTVFNIWTRRRANTAQVAIIGKYFKAKKTVINKFTEP